jgi:hypothetical protein
LVPSTSSSATSALERALDAPTGQKTAAVLKVLKELFGSNPIPDSRFSSVYPSMGQTATDIERTLISGARELTEPHTIRNFFILARLIRTLSGSRTDTSHHLGIDMLIYAIAHDLWHTKLSSWDISYLNRTFGLTEISTVGDVLTKLDALSLPQLSSLYRALPSYYNDTPLDAISYRYDTSCQTLIRSGYGSHFSDELVSSFTAVLTINPGDSLTIVQTAQIAAVERALHSLSYGLTYSVCSNTTTVKLSGDTIYIKTKTSSGTASYSGLLAQLKIIKDNPAPVVEPTFSQMFQDIL